MKLDPTVMRTMESKDYKVLEAVEKGMRNHALVPEKLIVALANLRHGGTGKIISSLLRDKLLSHETRKRGYDGYRITNAGYDILALHNLKSRGFVAAFGDRIGTGKESDVYLAVSRDGSQVVLKFHRLGRTSFRNVKQKRDYFNGKNQNQIPNSWLFLSRMSAIKEFAFMKALYEVDYPTPKPVAHNRHIVVMSLVRGVPLYQIIPSHISAEQAESIFQQATDMAVRLAGHGLVHCDLNEFNLLVDMSGIQSESIVSDDPYVRHSGMSVAASQGQGVLSGIGPWDQKEDYQFTGEEETALAPRELLENGDPKPVVTLIDFPQMVSTQHPNAKDLYERDLESLQRFFTSKLHCMIPEEDISSRIVQWEEAVSMPPTDGEAEKLDDDDDTCPVLQVRLDVELKASGYSEQDSKRDLELYYFETQPKLFESLREEDSGDEADDNTNEEKDDDADADSLPSEDNAEELGSIVDSRQLMHMEREHLEEVARARVQKQIEDKKKKNRMKGAFKGRNSNKNFVKGKRVMTDMGF